MTNPDDIKLHTNICVHRLLTFGFPKDVVARELSIDLRRVEEVISFYGKNSFPPPVTDRWEYFQRLTDLLISPTSHIEDPALEKQIDHVRARILVSILELDKGHKPNCPCKCEILRQLAEAPAFSRAHPEAFPTLMIGIAWASGHPHP